MSPYKDFSAQLSAKFAENTGGLSYEYRFLEVKEGITVKIMKVKSYTVEDVE